MARQELRYARDLNGVLMNTDERELLEEFRAYLQEEFFKKCVQAYVDRPMTSTLADQALLALEQAINEIDKS